MDKKVGGYRDIEIISRLMESGDFETIRVLKSRLSDQGYQAMEEVKLLSKEPSQPSTPPTTDPSTPTPKPKPVCEEYVCLWFPCVAYSDCSNGACKNYACDSYSGATCPSSNVCGNRVCQYSVKGEEKPKPKI